MANMNSRLGTWWNIGVSALVLSAFLITSTALRADGQDKTKPVTFSKDIAPILQEKCQDCHRPGQIAPMSLLTYQDARPWARDIKMRVLQRSMPLALRKATHWTCLRRKFGRPMTGGNSRRFSDGSRTWC